MSRSLNRAELIGHLGKDIEVRFTPSGIQVGQFTLATTRRWKDKQSQEWKEETDWHRCILWRCDNVAQFLLKGKQVRVEGRLQTRQYESKGGEKHYVTEIVVEDLMLLGGGGGSANAAPGQPQPQQPRPQQGAASSQAAPPDDYAGQGITDDDVPF